MNDFPFDLTIVGLAAILFLPWWLLLAIGAGLSIPWWKKWRFKNIAAADTRQFFEDNDITCRKPMMYLGLSQEGTIRWWYMRDGSYRSYAVPQAVDNGKVYWDKKVEIKNPMLIVHLNGFWAMGNEWPEYYKTITKREDKKKVYKKDKNKKTWVDAAMIKHPTSFDPAVIKAVESDLQRADYADTDDVKKYAATATISAIDENNAQLLELQKAVEDLEKEIHGRCPTLDFNASS